MKYTEKYINTR